MKKTFNFFASCPKGLEGLLLDELNTLKIDTTKETVAGVYFSDTLQAAYRVCLWSRLANRIFLTLKEIVADTADALYKGIKRIDWHHYFDIDKTFAIHFLGTNKSIKHTMFGAMKVKDAIVDQFREVQGSRPSVSREAPDVMIQVKLHQQKAVVSLDLSGESLHKRGYRLAKLEAPLKENLAAALLIRAGYAEIASQGGTLIDPMCGSGTILIEAALIASHTAPGLLRKDYGFQHLNIHDPSAWAKLITEAKEESERGYQKMPTIVGYDSDPKAIKIAFENIERAKLSGKIHVEKKEVSSLAPLDKFTKGLLITNPPYGERLGELKELRQLYKTLGQRMKNAFVGWKAGILTGNPDLGKVMGIRAKKYYAFFNGNIPCRFLMFDVNTQFFVNDPSSL